MATQSIKRNIMIHDKQAAAAFVEALEKAEARAEQPVVCNYSAEELRGADKIKAFFGDTV